MRLYNVKESQGFNYKTEIIKEFELLVEDLKNNEENYDRDSSLYLIMTQKDYWKYEDIILINQTLLDLKKEEFKHIYNYVLLIEILTIINNEFKTDLVKNNPNDFIEILQINNDLIDNGIDATIDELQVFSPQLFISKAVTFSQDFFCNGVRNDGISQNRFLQLMTNYTEADDLLYNESEDFFEGLDSFNEITTSTSLQIEILCKEFKKIFLELKDKFIFWTDNKILETQKIDSEKLENAVLEKHL